MALLSTFLKCVHNHVCCRSHQGKGDNFYWDRKSRPDARKVEIKFWLDGIRLSETKHSSSALDQLLLITGVFTINQHSYSMRVALMLECARPLTPFLTNPLTQKWDTYILQSS